MPRLSAAAVAEAIRQLSNLDLAPREGSLLEVFLTGRRMAAAGRTPTTATTGETVAELFVVLPDHPIGRLKPFGKDRASDRPKWIDNKPDSGRKTVWNAGTRAGARSLCVDDHLSNGLRPDAAELLRQQLMAHGDRRPGRQALLVYLLRDAEFEGVPTAPGLTTRAEADLGLTVADLQQITREIAFGVALGGGASWAPDLLPDDLRPPAAVATAAVVPAPAPVPAAAPPAVIVVDDRLRRMVRRAIASARGVVMVGPPGTGKSSLLAEIAAEICAAPGDFGLAGPALAEPLWVTAEEGWTSRELVGGESIVHSNIVYRPGHLLRAIAENRWLVIDELNRADMDKIFGAIFTWLAGDAAPTPNVSLGHLSPEPNAAGISLAWSDDPECDVVNREEFEQGSGSDPIVFRAGTSWRLLGTYNAVDAQRVFRLGQALGRRFVRVPVPPITPDEFALALNARAGDLGQVARDAIVNAYRAHLEAQAPEARLGPALFFRMANYIRRSQALGGDVAFYETLAEAYLINVGPWLARLEPADLEQLEERIEQLGVLPAAQWTWIETMIPNFS